MPSLSEGNRGYNFCAQAPILTAMITAIAIAAPLAALGVIDALALRFGAESRPGFDERTPIR